MLGTKYVVSKCWMMIGKQEMPTAILPMFGKLVDILLCGSQRTAVFVFCVGHTVCFEPMLAAYEIKVTEEYRCIFYTSLKHYELYNAVTIPRSTCLYIKPKIDLNVCFYY